MARLVSVKVLTDTHQHEGQPVEKGSIIRVPADVAEAFPNVFERVSSGTGRMSKLREGENEQDS